MTHIPLHEEIRILTPFQPSMLFVCKNAKILVLILLFSQKAKLFKKSCQIILVYSTLVAKYFTFTTISAKVLLNGNHLSWIDLQKTNLMTTISLVCLKSTYFDPY